MDEFTSGGTVLSGPGMVPRFKTNVMLRKRGRRSKKSVHIPRHMSKRDKRNLKRNLTTLGEKKYFFIGVSAAAQDNIPDITHITAIPQGDTDITRDGDQVTLRSIELNFEAYIPAVSDFTNIVRLMVFQWFPITAPTAADILLDTVTDPYLSPYNHDTRFQFRMLLDRHFTLSNQGEAVKFIRKYIVKFPQRKVQFIAGGTTGQNRIYVMTLSDSGTVGHPLVTWGAKVNYQDN